METAFGYNDMDQIMPGLFLGNLEAADNTENLQREGITHVLGLGEVEAENMEHFKWRHYEI